MENKKRIKKLSEAKYLVTFEIREPTFEAMLKILESAYKEMRKRGGKEAEYFGYADYYAWILSLLPFKRELLRENTTVSIAIIDVTEQETERPKHGKKLHIQVKKETHDKKPSSYKRRYKANYWHL